MIHIPSPVPGPPTVGATWPPPSLWRWMPPAGAEAHSCWGHVPQRWRRSWGGTVGTLGTVGMVCHGVPLNIPKSMGFSEHLSWKGNFLEYTPFLDSRKSKFKNQIIWSLHVFACCFDLFVILFNAIWLYIWFFDVLLIPQHDPEKVLEDDLLDIYRYVSSENEKQWVSMMSEFWCLGRDV